MSELPTSIGQFDGLSGQLVAVDCDGISRWNTAAHGPLGRQVAARPTGGPLEFDGVEGVAWSGRGGVRVSGVACDAGWRHVDVLEANAPAGLTAGPFLGSLRLMQSRLFIGDLATLGAWAPGQSLDGKIALRISGRDAAQVAGEGQLPPLADGSFGWTGMPELQAAQWKSWVEQQVARGWSVNIDYQTHDHRYAAETLIARSPVGAAEVTVGSDRCVVIDVRRPAGHFPVAALIDARGRQCGVRIVFESRPLDPKHATRHALQSAGADPVQGGGSKDGLRTLKDNLPRLLWPLLPDGERDFATRVRDFGQEKFLAMLGACLFIGCGMVSVLVGISFVSLYILYSLVHSL